MADKEGEKPVEEMLSMDTNKFEEMERDFQEVLKMLMGDKSLEKFRLEYEKLHGALKKSHEQEKRLIKRCKELNAEIVNNTAKVQTALKLSQEDQNTIAALKSEIDKAWKMVDAAHEKELRAKETIEKLKSEIANLTRLVEQGAGLSVGQDNTVNELLKLRDELQGKNEELQSGNAKLTRQVDEMQAKEEQRKEKKKQLLNRLRELETQLGEERASAEREARRKTRMDKELKQLKAEAEDKEKQMQTLSSNVDERDQRVGSLESEKRELESRISRLKAKLAQAEQDNSTAHAELEERDRRLKRLLEDRVRFEEEVKQKESDVARLEDAVQSAQRRVDKERRAAMKLEDKVGQEQTDKEVVRSELEAVKRELQAATQREEALSKQVTSLHRAEDMKVKQLQREQDKTKSEAEKVHTSERTAKALENEIRQYREEAQKQRKLIAQLETDCERYGINANDAHQKLLKTQEEVKLKEMALADLRKKVQHAEAKLKQQQQLYEAVRSDRNLYSKNLVESQDEIAEMKRKFKIMNHQIEQLKEEITLKDNALVKESMAHQQLQKDMDKVKKQLGKMKTLRSKGETTIEKQAAENEKLNHMISKMDSDALAQRKEYDQVINERDILGTQLIRRNDELALLYEKLKIQQSTLRKGEGQYQERLADIRILKLKVNDLKRALQIARHQVGQLDGLKREVYHLKRELLQEKTKVKALSEELENPMNVHRWRKLEGSDPATYEMIQKIQTLQRRLIAKTEECVERDLQIQEKNRLYQELKNILARQPGPEVAEQLSVYQQNLKEKTRQMKAMASELNMYQAQVNEYKYEIERVQRELQNVKRKYFEQKKREQSARDAAANESQRLHTTQQAAQQQYAAQTASNRFTGGGFGVDA